MKNVSLYFKEGSSDKEYHIQIVKSDGKYVVNFQYGRVGNALQSGTKTPTPVSLEDAEKIFGKLQREKEAKGYIVSEDTKNDFAGQEPIIRSEKKEVHILPQLLNTIEDDEIEKYINDESYLAQEKKDGERRIVDFGEDVIMGLNKKGQEVALPKCILVSFSGVATFDGEIIGDVLHVFDFITRPTNPCVDRIAMLNTLQFGNNIKIVKTAFTTKEKRELYEKLKSENAEGIVFKKKLSPYTAGRPASGGNALKFKFQKTATFIVSEHTIGKRSVELQLIDGKEKVFMGKVTIPPNHEIPKVGELVEVQYLYAYRDGAIFQPVYKGVRTDSDLTDCTISQLVYKADKV